MRDIFLATGLIKQGDLFNNGLHQNSLIVYSMLEQMGYRCHCIVEVQGPFVPGYRFLEPETYLQNDTSYCPVAYIEMGLSLDPGWRLYLQRKGCKTIKLYFGNILNIDTETVCCTPGMNFPHHVTGSLDEIWTSPHYAMNLPYALSLHGIRRGAIAPYVWDSTWIQGLNRWTPSESWMTTDLVIMEPNISFQKCSLYPILLVKAFAKAYPDWKGRLIVQNGDRLQMSRWFRDHIVPMLGLSVVWKGRQPLAEILSENPSAAFISHQLTNDYNYLVLELMHLGFPLLHNSQTWSTFGYTWSENRWSESVQTLRSMLEMHKTKEALYQSHARHLAWNVSPSNPVNQGGWDALIKNT
jgi:hypothetical protein